MTSYVIGQAQKDQRVHASNQWRGHLPYILHEYCGWTGASWPWSRLNPIVKAVVGISPRTDIVFNYAYNNGHGRSTYSGDYRSYNHDSSHTKLGIKYLLSQKEKTYISVLPSFYTLLTAKYPDWEWTTQTFRYKYDLWGMEGQLLLTHQTSQHISATLAAKAQFNNIEKTLDGSHYGPYFTANYGVRGNFRFSASIFHWPLSWGLEVLPIVNGETVVTTIGSLGFGVQF